MQKISFLLIGFSFLSYSLLAQLKTPNASPRATITQEVGMINVEIDYSRPSLRGRKIFNEIIEKGVKWRTGANKNTTISFDTDVVIDGDTLRKGKYGIYSIPNEKTWEIIFYSETGNSGIPKDWDDSKIALITRVYVEPLINSVETFTIALENLSYDSFNLCFSWGKMKVLLKVDHPSVEIAKMNIHQAMNGPTAMEYYRSASFYLQEEFKLDMALEWVKKAIDLYGNSPYWMYRTQGKIESKMGDVKAAKLSYNTAIKMAEKMGRTSTVDMLKREKGAL